MFRSAKKKRAVQVTFVKTPEDDASPNESKTPHPDTVNLIAEKSKDVVKFVALAAVGAYAAVKTIDTLSQIAIKKTRSADAEKK